MCLINQTPLDYLREICAVNDESGFWSFSRPDAFNIAMPGFDHGRLEFYSRPLELAG